MGNSADPPGCARPHARVARERRQPRPALLGSGECQDAGRDFWIAVNGNEGECALAGEPFCLPSIWSLLGRNERGK
jgi:hypothetical protein